MSSSVVIGKEIKEIELLDIFPATEGMICQYYGRIGSGKTYAATSDLIDLLRRGKVVYANWPINYNGYDERFSGFRVIVSILFPWIKRFYYFPRTNLHYYEISNKWAQQQGYRDFDHWVSTRTDCYFFADEGHVWFDSYASTRIPMERRTIALHTRHFNRNICIISQRPTAIHVSMRANVNVFYKCEKVFQLGPIVRFKRTEYQEMQNENVDEGEDKALSTKWYWGKKDVFNSYNTRYLRGGLEASQKPKFKAFNLNLWDKIRLLYQIARGNKPKSQAVVWGQAGTFNLKKLYTVNDEEESLPSPQGEPTSETGEHVEIATLKKQRQRKEAS